VSLIGRIREEAETRLGLTVVPRLEHEKLQEHVGNLEAFMHEASELGYHALSYFAGRPQDVRPEYRNRLAQKSRVAQMEDPLAGAQMDLLANFAFGRGIGVPDAEDEKVQEVIQEAWEDPVNVAKLTGFEAQRHRSAELLAQANLYPTAFVGDGGRVRLGFLDADRVPMIIADPEDEERPLFYATQKRRVEFDFETDQFKPIEEVDPSTHQFRVEYWPHWRNVEDYVRECKETGEKAQLPPERKLGRGLVEHVRINRIGRTQFGTPPLARTLRFLTAMNVLTEAHVAMAQAASTFVAKRTVQASGPEAITRAASNVLAQTGEIAARTFGAGTPPPGMNVGGGVPPAPGSFWLENQSSKLESLSLNSGAAQAAQTAQIVRAPIAAASQFGQHYLGDAGNANLATATSLELPSTMVVQAWQETFRQMLKWFTDMVVQEAVRAGRLGGVGASRVSNAEVAEVLAESEDLSVMDAAMAAWERLDATQQRVRRKPLSELRLSEAEDRAEAERRTGKELGYTLSMPYPGRRNLPDVTNTVTAMITAFDPMGVNLEMRRQFLLFLATHGMQVDDPIGWVDAVLPEDSAGDLMGGLNPQTGQPWQPGEQEAQALERTNAVPPPPEPGTGPPSKSSKKASGSGGGGSAAKRERPSGARGSKLLADEVEELPESVSALFEWSVMEPALAERNGHAPRD